MTEKTQTFENDYPEIFQALQVLVQSCKEAEGKWLLGGSCGLWLQGVPLAAAPRDIDVYTDLEHAEWLHQLLAEFAVDKPRLDQSGNYVSQLSHYRLNTLTLELVGGFQVKTKEAVYKTEVAEKLVPASQTVRLGTLDIRLMPLAHEFVFNVLRARPDRYAPIAGVIRRNPQLHLPLLSELLERNLWTSGQIAKMADLLDQPLLSGRWGELGNSLG